MLACLAPFQIVVLGKVAVSLTVYLETASEIVLVAGNSPAESAQLVLMRVMEGCLGPMVLLGLFASVVMILKNYLPEYLRIEVCLVVALSCSSPHSGLVVGRPEDSRF